MVVNSGIIILIAFNSVINIFEVCDGTQNSLAYNVYNMRKTPK
jgi:hypothetical protein